MGPLNEFQRRWLDVATQYKYLMEANAGGPHPEFFGYTLQLGSATDTFVNGATKQGTIAIQADAWFLWTYVSTGVTIPNTATFGGPAQITDAANILLDIVLPGMGEDLYNIPAGLPGMPAALSTGSPINAAAGIPFIFPTPVLLPPNTNVTVSATKLGTNAGGDNPDMTGFWFNMGGARIQVWS
jgi:hypothetical protein